MTTGGKTLYTLGNALMLIGLTLLLFIGGLLADEQYNVYAASGSYDAEPIVTTSFADDAVAVGPANQVRPAFIGPRPLPTPAPSSTALPVEETLAVAALPPLPTQVEPQVATPDEANQGNPAGSAEQNAPVDEAKADQSVPVEAEADQKAPVEAETGSEGQLTNAVPPSPAVAPNSGPSSVTRIIIPAIKVDKKVVEVGWTVEQQTDGQFAATWEVDRYRVGHHSGTSNPGYGGNIVLAGHSGGRAYPFNDIFYLKPGDLIQLWSNGQPHDYTVFEHVLLDEVGQPLEKRMDNARYIGPTEEELVTMVACWPLSGPDKFKQRIVIRAKPAATAASNG